MREDPVDDGVGLSGKLTVCQILRQEVVELRWRVLIVVCFLTFGSYYVFDLPGSIGVGSGATIGEYFFRHGKEYTQGMNQLLYSVYSWPNTVLSIFGGLLMDKYFGLRISMLLFTFLVLLGSLFFWLGLYCVNFPLMVAARVIFGLGGESLSVAQSAYVARWFKSARGIALAFGITISFSRVGSSFNFLLSPKIAEAWDVNAAALAGFFSCLISFGACCILTWADIYAARTGYIRPEPREAISTVMKFSDILRLPLAFWILTVICVFCYCAIFPFIGIGTNFFEVKYNYTSSQASSYISAYQFASAAGSPVIGFLVDVVGREAIWLVLSSVCFVLTHVLLGFTAIPGIVLMIMMGIFYSFLVSGLWPAVPWVVNENVLGFSYGVMTALQNTGLSVFPIVLGNILDRHTPGFNTSSGDGTASSLFSLGNETGGSPLPSLEGYIVTEWLFIGAALVSFFASVVLVTVDLRHDGVLTASRGYRRRLQAEKDRVLAESVSEHEKVLLPTQVSE